MLKNLLKTNGTPFGKVVVKITVALFLLIFLSVFAAESFAQASLSPPISPWLNMFNNNRGNPLSNYHTYVRPQQNMIREFQSQDRQIRQQASQQQQLQSEMGKVLDMPRQRPSAGGMRGCGYGQHMHFYQNIPPNPVPMFHTPGRR